MEKENLELKQLKKLAREKLLGNEYGKYDYVEKLLGRDFILGNPPRLVRSYLCELLKIQKENLKYDTFMSWLKSYRKKEAKQKKDSSVPDKQTFSSNDINDSSNFIPTDPRILDKKREEDYLKDLIKMPYAKT
ncbi:MAG: hypothetical protein ABI359_15260 [Ginsengibacter sp.]